MKDCELTVGTKNEDGEWETVKTMDRECLQEVALECPGKINSHQYLYSMKIVVL